MSDQNNFFLTDTSGVLLINTIEMTHPDFSAPMLYQCDIIDSDLITSQGTFKYQIFEAERGNITSDLDQSVSITFVDFDDAFMQTVTSINKAIPIELIFRQYREDDLTSPLDFIQTLRIKNISADEYGKATFSATAEQLNNVATGVIYTLEDYPLMKGLI